MADTLEKEGLFSKIIDWGTGYPVWARFLDEYQKRNKSDAYHKKRSPLYARSDRIYSGTENVIYVYTFDRYSEYIPVNFKYEIRKAILDNRNMVVNFFTVVSRESFDFSSQKNKGWLQSVTIANKNLEQYEDNDLNNVATDTAVSRNIRTKKTVGYLKFLDLSQRKLISPKICMYVIGKRGVEFDRGIESIEAYLKANQIGATRVIEDIQEYHAFFSMFNTKIETSKSFYKKLGNQLMSDEQAANVLFGNDGGTIGFGDFMLGEDIYTGHLVLTMIKKDSQDPENFFVAAGTGNGKSFKIKSNLIQYLARDNYIATVNDIEGDEYEQLAIYLTGTGMSVQVLNMGQGSGVYFDPCEIHGFMDSGTSNDKDNNAYKVASLGIKNILRVICFGKREMSDTENNLINYIIGEAYKRRNVSPNDKSSWRNSRGMTLQDVYAVAKELSEHKREKYDPVRDANESFLVSNIKIDKKFGESIGNIRLALEEYFEPNGINSSAFKSALPLSQFIKAKLVINDFGMRGKDNSIADDKELALSQVYSSQISYLRTLYAWSHGLYSVNVFEEFQRAIEIAGVYNHVKVILSGSRKNGGVNYIASNEPYKLVKNYSDFFENINNYIIGGVVEQVMDDLLTLAGAKQYKEELIKISNSNKADEGDSYRNNSGFDDYESDYEYAIAQNPYKHAFLISRNKGEIVAVTREPAAPEIIDNKLFYTGVKSK